MSRLAAQCSLVGLIAYCSLASACGGGQGAKSIAGAPASPVEAAEATPPRAAAPVQHLQEDELVDVQTILPELQLDMRYASLDNFVGKVIYPKSRCRLRRRVALALKKVQAILAKDQLRILVWDCYRPFSVQEVFWNLVPDGRYVAEPRRDGTRLLKGSKHNRGAAIDLTLVNASGEPLLMPTDFDDFSERAHRDAKGVAPERWENAQRLARAMESAGFVGIPTEWWHFDHHSWREFALSDEPL